MPLKAEQFIFYHICNITTHKGTEIIQKSLIPNGYRTQHLQSSKESIYQLGL